MNKKNKPYPLYDLPVISDLKELIEQQTQERPDSMAFSFSKGRSICNKTFREVAEDVNRVGAFLYANNLRDKHIAIVGENSYEWIITFLAIVNGGMVAVPIDKEFPGMEINSMLLQGDCEAVIFSQTYSEFLDEMNLPTNCSCFSMKKISEVLMKSDDRNAEFLNEYKKYTIAVNKIAAIFFTSGTTGSCKGVPLTHHNMAADINYACKNVVLNGNTLSVLPFHHAFGLITGIFKAFNYGKTIYINKSLKRIPQDLKNSVPQNLFLVPLYVETFYKQIWKSAEKNGEDKKLKMALKLSDLLLSVGVDFRKHLFSQVLDFFGGNLEYIICGGARLDPFYVKEFRRFGIEILSGYGITECSPVISVNRNYYKKDGSVGLVLQGCTVKISEENEILVSGDNVCRGYYKDEKNTSALFKDGWYATGDLGYLDDEGFLFITGRKKDLIILSNGENVSPEQIEQQLLRNSALQEIIVFSQNTKLVAEIFPSEEYMGNQEYFDSIIYEYNQTQPIYRQITKVYLRTVEFEKNTNKKVLRYKVMEAHKNV